MAVAKAKDASGHVRVLVGTSEPRGYIRPGVTINPGEVVVTGSGHAEANIVAHAQQQGMQVVEIGATRPICSNCANIIAKSGAISVTPFK